MNPIRPGFHPDPSICRVGTDFYLVTSTFEYFPGLPVHHSRDLLNWRLIGHVLDRPEQLNLDGVRSSGGLYAPTIRWYRGVFYVVCTLVDPPEGQPGGNFVVTATDPAGPWSDPVWLGAPESFDPSLVFFDQPDGDDSDGDSGDSAAWFCATRPNPAAAVEGGTEVWVQAFDPQKLVLVGPEQVIWHGALVDAVWAEAPHLYQTRDGVLLLVAEGGTAHDHAVTCARAERVTGPYANNPRNPVLTHRHLGLHYPVVGVGHADLVEAADGSWWAVALAMRPRWRADTYHYTLGRETFLAEVSWEDGWPVVNPGVGALRPQQSGLTAFEAPTATSAPEPARDDFDRTELGPHWSYVRTPRTEVVSLTERPGWLTLYPQPAGIEDVGCPGFVCRPQDSWEFSASGWLDFSPQTELDVAGIVLRQNENYALQLLVSADPAGARTARVIRRFGGQDELAAERAVPDGPIRLWVTGSGLDYSFGVNETVLATLDGRALSTTASGGFTGTMIGPYVHGHAPARWDWLEYFRR